MIQPSPLPRSASCEQILLCEPGVPDLFVRRFTATSGEASRTLLVSHGATEHGQRYAHVAGLFVEAGWNVVIPDLRGHGRSGGDPMHVGTFFDYVADLERARRYFALEPSRTALLGHSMGSLVAALAAEETPAPAAALVLLSPLLGVRVAVPAATFAAGRMMSLVAPGTRFRTRVDPHDVTQNPAALARRARDPFNHRHVTAGWFFAMRAGLRAAFRNAGRMKLPLLLLQGCEDRIVDSSRSREWLAAVGSADLAFRELPEHFHELHNEPTWPETFAEIAAWLDGRISAASAARAVRGLRCAA
jgi:lysophospholipase